MPVISQKAKIAYFDVPKVACTTLKWFFWYLETGKSHSPQTVMSRWFPNSHKYWEIHEKEGYQTCSFARVGTIPAELDSVTIVRDPVLRLHSAWKNKASQSVFEQRDEIRDLWLECLPTNPSFGEFIDHFDRYRMVSRPVRIHTYHYDWHLGPNLDAYDYVFELETLSEFKTFLSQRLGYDVSFPRENSASEESRDSSLTIAQRDKLHNITRHDYNWLGDRYSFEQSYERLKSRTQSKSTIA